MGGGKMWMNGKSGGYSGGEKGVMNYSSRAEDGSAGCQLTNQAESEEESRREGTDLRYEQRERDGNGESFRKDKK